MNFREYGDHNGAPLFFFHGWPGSASQASLAHDAARESGFRIIAPDRPGIGGSPNLPGRRVSDWPAQLASLADSLGIARFSVLGVSGGGPYALAAAWGLPERVIAASVVCGAPPIAELPDTRGLHPGYRALLWIYARRPDIVRRILAAARPFMFWREAAAYFPPLRILLPRPDAESIAEPAAFAGVFECQRDAFANVDGLFADAETLAQPWGFRPEEIRVPTHFWHGREDENFHHSLGATLARRVAGAQFTLVENEGHFSIAIRQVRPVLAALREATGLR